jgi:hypothetical protein
MLAALPMALAFALGPLDLTEQSRGVLIVVPAALGALCAAFITLIADRPRRGWARLHLVECVGLYLWLAIGVLMQGEGLTAAAGVVFGAAALGAILSNVAVLRLTGSDVAAA